ncbi:NADP-dependent oxidoreductase [Mycolicibacterium sp. 3033]|nr:NADP-dependent oxidoreductase [Mycolicibacterium aurantiacum]
MSRAVRFDHYGGIEVLSVRDVPRPVPGPGRVLIEVRAAGINPGEALIREGFLHDRWPATFPSGQGSDVAGVVVEVAPDVAGVSVGDDVLGFSDERSSHAEYVAVPAEQVTPKPAGLSWEQAGSLAVAGTTACAAVRSLELSTGDAVAVSAAAGGVGSLAVQLAVRTGATVLGIAGQGNDDWLREHGVVPVNYGDDLAERLRAAAPDGRVDAFLDLFGGGYVEMAVTELGVAPGRVDTIIDFAAVERFGVLSVGGAESGIEDLAELADLIARGDMDLPIAAVYPLDEVRAAYTDLAARHSRGKVVLRP